MARQCGACKLVKKLVRKEGKREFDAAFGIDAFSGEDDSHVGCGRISCQSACMQAKEDTMAINTDPTQWRRKPWQR